MELVKFFATDLTIDIKSLVPTSRNDIWGQNQKQEGLVIFNFLFDKRDCYKFSLHWHLVYFENV